MIIVRNKKTYKGPGFYIGRPSVLGNPYSCKEKSLAKYRVKSDKDAVSNFREYATIQYIVNEEFKNAIEEIIQHSQTHKETNLICWCSPNDCHGDVIKEYVEKELLKRSNSAELK